MHGTEEASKIWMVEVSTFEYLHYSEELMHLLSVTLNLIRRFTKIQVPRGGVYGGLVILAYPRFMVRECTFRVRERERERGRRLTWKGGLEGLDAMWARPGARTRHLAAWTRGFPTWLAPGASGPRFLRKI